MWFSNGDSQLYLSTLATQPLGPGPSLIATALVPDRHFFRGSYGGKNTFPLYRDVAGTEPNILPGFLAFWGKKLKREVTPESFAAYVYALLGHAGFVDRFWDESEDCQLRIPLTLDAKLFDNAADAGARLVFLHTYGERFSPKGKRAADVPTGKARVKEAVSDKPADYPEKFDYIENSRILRVGNGAFAPVGPAIWKYEVSGLQVVRSRLGYRMKDRKGKKSSPLDDIHPERWTSDFTDELLRLVWILEHTLAMGPELSKLLEAVCGGQLLPASDLPPVPAHLRKPPKAGDGEGFFGGEDEPDEEKADGD